MAIHIDGATGSSEKWCRACDLDKLGKSDTEPEPCVITSGNEPPAFCYFKIATICSSIKRLRFIPLPPRGFFWPVPKLYLVQFLGGRSPHTPDLQPLGIYPNH